MSKIIGIMSLERGSRKTFFYSKELIALEIVLHFEFLRLRESMLRSKHFLFEKHSLNLIQMKPYQELEFNE